MNFVTAFKCAHYAQQVNRIAHSAHSLRRLTIPLARVTPVRRASGIGWRHRGVVAATDSASGRSWMPASRGRSAFRRRPRRIPIDLAGPALMAAGAIGFGARHHRQDAALNPHLGFDAALAAALTETLRDGSRRAGCRRRPAHRPTMPAADREAPAAVSAIRMSAGPRRCRRG
jgi:hypothetical protein